MQCILVVLQALESRARNCNSMRTWTTANIRESKIAFMFTPILSSSSGSLCSTKKQCIILNYNMIYGILSNNSQLIVLSRLKPSMSFSPISNKISQRPSIVSLMKLKLQQPPDNHDKSTLIGCKKTVSTRYRRSITVKYTRKIGNKAM